MEYALSNYGHVDILVNGAAGNFLSEAKRLSPKGFKTVMEIDAQGTYNMSYAIYSAMTKSGNGGVIINISMTLHYGGEVLLRIPASIALILWFHVKMAYNVVFDGNGTSHIISYVVSSTCFGSKERNRFVDEKFGSRMGM